MYNVSACGRVPYAPDFGIGAVAVSGSYSYYCILVPDSYLLILTGSPEHGRPESSSLLLHALSYRKRTQMHDLRGG